MLRSHRRWHVAIWAVLAVAIAAGAVYGLAARKPIPVQPAPAVTEARS